MGGGPRYAAAGTLLALVLLIAGCGGSDTGSVKDADSVRDALHGHWVTESGKSQYYFAASSLVMIDNGRRTDQTYTVLESHEDEGWIKIRVKTGYGAGRDKKLVFSKDRKSITETAQIEVAGQRVSGTNRWSYVDARSAP